jgi:alanyl aminopeptidase
MWWWSVALAETGRLQDPVTPTRQEVHLTLDPALPAYQGRVEIDLRVEERIRSFHLHAQGLVVKSAALRRGHKTVAATAALAPANMLRIDAEKALRPGEWTLEITFEGTTRAQGEALGLYRVEHEGKHYVTSQFEANDARTAWPCFDEPVFKVPLALSVDVPPGLVAVSNAPVASDTEKDGVRTVTFDQTPPVPSYAWALSVGPFTSIEIPDMPVPGRVYTLAGREQHATSLAPEVVPLLRWLETWFGEPYPYDKLDFIIIPGFAFGAMENPGSVVMNEFFVAEPGLSTPAQRREMLHVVAHEVGHMWFGNLVTLRWWDDLWLNESFAEWVSMRAVAGVYPELAVPVQQTRHTVNMLEYDGRASTQPLRTEVDPTAVFETVNFAVYHKGSALLDMTESWLGPETFRAGVRRYLGTYRGSTATAQDLFGVLGLTAGLPVRDTLLPWLDQAGAPSLSFSRRPDGRISVSQQRFLSAGSVAPEDSAPLWPIPMTLRVGRPDGSVDLVTVRLTHREQALELGEVSWLLPTAGGLGYYNFTLSSELDEALLRAAPGLQPVERLRIVAAVRHGFLAGQRTVGDVLRTMEAFSAEREPEVVRELLSGATGLVDLARDSEDEQLVARAEEWLRLRASGWLTALDPTPFGGPVDPGEPMGLANARQSLVSTLAEVRDPQIRAELKGLAERFLADRGSVPLELAELAIKVAAEDDDTFGRTLRAQVESETSPELRRTLLAGATRAGGVEQRLEMLDWAVRPEGTVPDLYTVWYTSLERRSERDRVVDWQLSHHDALLQKMPDVYWAQLARSAEGCRADRLERVKTFYSDPSRKMPGIDQVLREMEDTLQICRTLQEIHGPALAAALSAQASK